jgi:hypothetical protein
VFNLLGFASTFKELILEVLFVLAARQCAYDINSTCTAPVFRHTHWFVFQTPGVREGQRKTKSCFI